MQELELTAKESFNESIERENHLAENAPQSIDQVRYENIVYQNTVAALLAGAELTGRNGKTKHMLYTPSTQGMTQSELETEARVMASCIVG